MSFNINFFENNLTSFFFKKTYFFILISVSWVILCVYFFKNTEFQIIILVASLIINFFFFFSVLIILKNTIFFYNLFFNLDILKIITVFCSIVLFFIWGNEAHCVSSDLNFIDPQFLNILNSNQNSDFYKMNDDQKKNLYILYTNLYNLNIKGDLINAVSQVVDDVHRNFGVEELTLYTPFYNRFEFLTENLLLNSHSNKIWYTIIDFGILQSMYNQGVEGLSMSLFGFEGELNYQTGLLELNLPSENSQNYHVLFNSLLYRSNFNSFWDTKNLECNPGLVLDYVSNVARLQEYPVLHANSIIINKILGEYILKFDELLNLHNILASENHPIVNEPIDLNLTTVFHKNNPSYQGLLNLINKYELVLR